MGGDWTRAEPVQIKSANKTDGGRDSPWETQGRKTGEDSGTRSLDVRSMVSELLTRINTSQSTNKTLSKGGVAKAERHDQAPTRKEESPWR